MSAVINRFITKGGRIKRLYRNLDVRALMLFFGCRYMTSSNVRFAFFVFLVQVEAINLMDSSGDETITKHNCSIKILPCELYGDQVS